MIEGAKPPAHPCQSINCEIQQLSVHALKVQNGRDIHRAETTSREAHLTALFPTILAEPLAKNWIVCAVKSWRENVRAYQLITNNAIP